MKITFSQLALAMPSLKILSTQKISSVKLGYKLGRIIKSAEAEFSEFNDALTKLLNSSGVQSQDDRTKWEIEPEKQAEFQTQYAELIAVEVEIWGDPFTLADLDGQIELTAADYAALDWLIIEAHEPQELAAKAGS